MGAKRKIEIATRSNTKKNDSSLTDNDRNSKINLSNTAEDKGIFHVQPSSSHTSNKGMKEIYKCIGTNDFGEQVSYDFKLVPRCGLNKTYACRENYLCGITENNGYKKSIREMRAAYAQIFESDSCLWSPSSRKEWDDCADEMTALCNTAMYFRKGNESLCKKNVGQQLTSIPLTYIKDRIDIDDPLSGYQVRHRTGGWLQGFVMITPFTTWTCYFKWDSLHVKSGMVHSHHICPDHAWDSSGSFSAELEKQPRSGDPHQGGVIWSTIAEISVVGGLGCGELLVRMALDEARRKGFDYVVLQATESSRSFYEKLGFCRVGAVARYLKKKDGNTLRSVVGYRHWTYADEKNLEYHGRPSIMMAIRIDSSWPPILDLLSSHFVDKKPTINKLSSDVDLVTPPSKKIKLNYPRTSSPPPDSKPHVVPVSPVETRSSPRTSAAKIDSDHLNIQNYFIEHKTIPINELKKQKITDLKRDNTKPPFFSKIVQSKNSKSYFFVTNYDSPTNAITLVPLECVGLYKGNRDGRKKFKAKVEVDNGEKVFHIHSAPFYYYEIVPATIVTKTNIVCKESWDIHD